MAKTPALPENNTLALAIAAKTPEEKAKAQMLAGNYTTNERFPEPVPQFFTEMPFGGDNDELTDRMALALLTSDNPDKDALQNESLAFRDLVGHEVTVHDLRVMPGGMESGWNAYLILDITVDNDPTHRLANTGAKKPVIRLAQAWAAGEMPITGRVVEIQTRTNSGNKPLAFIAETAL